MYMALFPTPFFFVSQLLTSTYGYILPGFVARGNSATSIFRYSKVLINFLQGSKLVFIFTTLVFLLVVFFGFDQYSVLVRLIVYIR